MLLYFKMELLKPGIINISYEIYWFPADNACAPGGKVKTWTYHEKESKIHYRRELDATFIYFKIIFQATLWFIL
jgi:hypothetical protein